MSTKEEKPSGLVQLNTRMPQSAIDELDAWTRDLNAEAGWEKYSRSDVVREAIMAALVERRAARKKGAKR